MSVALTTFKKREKH